MDGGSGIDDADVDLVADTIREPLGMGPRLPVHHDAGAREAPWRDERGITVRPMADHEDALVPVTHRPVVRR